MNEKVGGRVDVEEGSFSGSVADGHKAIEEVSSGHQMSPPEVPTPAVLRLSMSTIRGDGGGDDDEALLERSSIIHLLRVYVGAVHPEPKPCAPWALGSSECQKEGGSDDAACPPPKRPGQSPPRSPAGVNHAVVDTTAPAEASSISARIDAGCTLWDISITEKHASAMYSAGLVPVACTVLRHCAEAEELLTRSSVMDSSHRLAEKGKEEHGEGRLGGVRGARASEVVDACSGASLQESARLREITCGLLANVCSHRTLRRDVVGDALLGEELLLAFHSTDDPACLTEILRLFSAAAMASTMVTPEGDGEALPQTATLASGLVARDTLERIVFFVENSLEEKLLAWACSLAYSIMYRHGDDVIRPLVEFRLEEALASLLNTRSTDLSYERQVGGSETGLDVLLRCLEVLSTSEISSIGPSVPPQHSAGSSAALLPAPPGVNKMPPPGLETTVSPAIKAGNHNSDTGGAAVAGVVVDGNEDESLVEGYTSAASVAENAAGSAAGATVRAAGDTSFNEAAVPGGQIERTDNSGGGALGVLYGPVPVSSVVKSNCSGAVQGGVRQTVIRGLVKALVPWEHARRSQRAALLVLGNVLENVVEREEHEIARDSQGLVQQCVIELDKGLLGGGDSSGGVQEKEEEVEGERGIERDPFDRLRRKRIEFLDSIAGLVTEGRQPDGDDLQEELGEAVVVVRKVLKESLG